jgi:hypothetical protein
MEMELLISTITLGGSIFFMMGSFTFIKSLSDITYKLDYIYNKLKNEVPPAYSN